MAENSPKSTPRALLYLREVPLVHPEHHPEQCVGLGQPLASWLPSPYIWLCSEEQRLPRGSCTASGFFRAYLTKLTSAEGGMI